MDISESLKMQEKHNVVIFANTGLEVVKPLYEANINIVGVIESKDRHTITNPVKKMLTNINRFFTGRDKAESLREYSENRNIPYLTYLDHSPDEVSKWIKELNADLMLSHQAPILPPEVFEAPKMGSINLHPTLLPKYRGSNPFFWMYYFKDMTAGITIHKIDQNIDTGSILIQRSCSVDYGTDADQLERDIVKHLAVPALIELIKSYHDEMPTVNQPDSSPTPYAKRMDDDEYRKRIFEDGFSIKQFWHLLHANSQWQSALIGKHYDPAFDWAIDGYEALDHNYSVGETLVEKKRIGVAHHEGMVWFEKRFNFNRYLANRVLS